MDTTEIYVQKPELPDLQQITFFNYKDSNTYKIFTDLYAGGILDKTH